MSELRHVRQWVYEQPWAIREQMLGVIADAVEAHMRDETPAAAAGLSNGASKADVKVERGIATVPIHGVIMQRAQMFERMSGAVSLPRIKANLIAALESDAKTVLLDFDSPGGEVAGTEEMANFIFHARAANDKMLIAWTDRQMCSAAYWLASQCDVVFATKDSEVGSIGIITRVSDTSRLEKNVGLDSHTLRTGPNKSPGIGGVTDAMLKPLRERMDQHFGAFVDSVERGREIALGEDVKTGRTYTGFQATSVGLVDGVMSLDEIFSKYGSDN